MKLSFDLIPKFPKLAWLAVVHQQRREVLVSHGSMVETHDSFFVEGTWNDNFRDGGFLHTDCFFGSGATLANEQIVFVPSAATTDMLHYKIGAGRVHVSNSLALLLASLNDRLDPQCAIYDQISFSINAGINDYVALVPTRAGNVNRLLYRNLRVGRSSHCVAEKLMPPPFATYDDYVRYLDDNYRRLQENMHSSDRRYPVSIYTTQSRGYDSTAVNSIAASYGADMAFTVPRSKAPGYWVTEKSGEELIDDGTQICRFLNLPVAPINHRAFENDFAEEHLFYCAIHQAQDANLLDLIRQVQGPAVLLTGSVGDVIWTTDKVPGLKPDATDELRRGDLSLLGLSEIRLDAGLIQLPLPYIGARRRRDINRITHSDEMAPWRLGNAYDRPIPRRIAEEKGVARHWFGQQKMKTVTAFPEPTVPQGYAFRRQYLAFLREEGLTPFYFDFLLPAIHWLNKLILSHTPTHYRIVYYLERLLTRIVRREFRFGALFSRLGGRIFCYCVNRRADEYQGILDYNSSPT
jgi:hypothetical protein